MAEEQKDDLNLGENERVGDYLHRIRKIRGLELEHLAKSIRLGKNILEAIESNNWNYFPTEAYLRSYIVSLCDKLSLDKNIVLKKFSAEINSQFWITQTNIMDESNHEKDSSDAPSSNVPKAAIIIILLIIALLFFASKILNNYSKEEDEEFYTDLEKLQKTEKVETLEENAPDSSLSKNDSVPIFKAAETVTVVPDIEDSFRFECIPSTTDSTCGVKVKDLDTKMSYFKKTVSRLINRKDTMQITITVPLRTKLFINNTRLDYGNYNILLFHNGKIIDKKSKELR